MKRKALIKHIENFGSILKREGRKHTIYQRRDNVTQIPRHSQLADDLAWKICWDLDISFVR